MNTKYKSEDENIPYGFPWMRLTVLHVMLMNTHAHNRRGGGGAGAEAGGLVRGCGMHLTPCMTDEEASRIQSVALQDKRDRRRIRNCPSNASHQLVRWFRLGESPTIQPCNSTDVSLSVVLVFVRYVCEGDASKERTAFIFEALKMSGSHYLVTRCEIPQRNMQQFRCIRFIH
jgi:hypothetical protein